MKRLKFLALASLVAFAACDEEGPPTTTEPPAPQMGNIAGTVTAGGENVELTVTLAGPESRQATSTGGSFSFNNVVVGTYAVSISSIPGDYVFGTTTATVTVTANQTTDASFSGQIIRTASISGTVSAGGDLVEGATIDLSGPEGGESEVTGADGSYQFTGLRSGSYTLSLTAPEGVECAVAEATVELSAGEAEISNFGCEGTSSDAPEVTIERITAAGATPAPVDPDSIVGRVEVTMNIDPRDSELRLVALTATPVGGGNTTLIFTQSFNTSGANVGEDGPQAIDELDITASWNSDRIRAVDGSTNMVRVTDASVPETEPIPTEPTAPYGPIFFNGDYNLTAHVFWGTEEDATEPQTATVNVTLRNVDAVNLGVVADNSDWNDPVGGYASPFANTIIETAAGLRWLSGDIIITAYPIVYSEPFDPKDPVYQRALFQFDAFVAGVDGTHGGAELTAPNGTVDGTATGTANGTFVFRFCENHPTPNPAVSTPSGCYGAGTGAPINRAGVAATNTGRIGARNVRLITKTAFGQFGPTLANLKSIEFFGEDLQSGTGVLNDILRIDNEGPTAPALALAPHPVNGAAIGFSRSGIFFQSTVQGWINHDYAFVSNGWTPPPSDIPFTYPAVDQFGVAPLGPDGVAGSPDDCWLEAFGNLCPVPGALLNGIGVDTRTGAQEIWHAGPNYGGGTVVGAKSTSAPAALVETGADLTPETGPGLDALPPPNSNQETDYGIQGRGWDQFGNPTNSGIILVGVDGQAPIFCGTAAACTVPRILNDPTVAGTVYNTYSSATSSPVPPGFPIAKTAGQYMGSTTDTGNGFSGVAGIEIQDWENGCPSVTDVACAGAPTNYRGVTGGTSPASGRKDQPITPTTTTTILGWTFDATAAPASPTTAAGAGANDIWGTGDCPGAAACATGMGVIDGDVDELFAYVADRQGPPNVASLVNDGYRQQWAITWDRAANSATSAAVTEHINDEIRPAVGNVEMPTVVTFTLGTVYTFGGEANDNADLKKTDFDFDFNSVLSLQYYTDPVVATPQRPVPDADGRLYQPTSLQLPLVNMPHTAFGSAAILRDVNLDASAATPRDNGTTNFLGCMVRFDEAGIATVASTDGAGNFGPAEPTVHRPRGPRWRTWDHASTYGHVNTQFNTFVVSSVPSCDQNGDGISTGPLDAAGVAGFGPDFTPNTADDVVVPALGLVGAGPDGVGGNADDGTGPDGVAGTLDDDVSWQFFLAGGTTPTLVLKGPSPTFVPTVDPNNGSFWLYYQDPLGRAILWDPGTDAWNLVVTDTGGGPFGRWYAWTYGGTLPADITPSAGLPFGDTGGWFFVFRRSLTDGLGLIWDESSN